MMAGAEQYVRGSRQNATHPPAQSLRRERAAAMDLKIPLGGIRPNPDPSNVNNQNYSSSRNSFSDQYTHGNRNTFDDTLTSSIESSDGYLCDSPGGGLGAGEEVYRGGINRADQLKSDLRSTAGKITPKAASNTSPCIEQSHMPDYVQGRNDSSPKKAPQISGRFQFNPSQRAKNDGDRDENSAINSYKKRGRCEGLHSHIPVYQPALSHDDGHMVMDEEDEDLTEHVKLEPGLLQNRLSRGSSNASDYSDGNQSDQQQIQAPEKQHVVLPDYSEETLRNMSYVQLLKEDFDKHPGSKPAKLPAKLQNPQDGIADKMAHCLELDKVAQEQGEPSVLKDFFLQMSKDEWEEAGDCLIDRFADTLKDFKDARRKKRDLVKDHEATVHEREQIVKEKCHALDLEMSRMKENGMKVVKVGKPK